MNKQQEIFLHCYISHWSKVNLQTVFITFPLPNLSVNLRLKVTFLPCWQSKPPEGGEGSLASEHSERARGMEILKNLKKQGCSNTLFYYAVLSSISILAPHWCKQTSSRRKNNSKSSKRSWYNFHLICFDIFWVYTLLLISLCLKSGLPNLKEKSKYSSGQLRKSVCTLNKFAVGRTCH